MNSLGIDESVRRQFEADWLAGSPQSIDHYLPSPLGDDSLGTLEELVAIEMEFIWKSTRTDRPIVEHYLRRFPRLSRGNIVVRMLAQEFDLRKRFADAPTVDEYRARFPQLEAQWRPLFNGQVAQQAAAVEPNCEPPREIAPGAVPLSQGDRNLLIGALAVQLDFITRDALIAAMNAWLLDKHKPLGEILLVQGALKADRLQLLDSLVSAHLKHHDHDAEKSLSAVGAVHAIREDLRHIDDPELSTSLGHVTTAGADVTRLWISQKPKFAGQRFVILRPHARGGLGEVFVAKDEELGREVALKQIQPRQADSPQSRSRFLREAEITGGLEHPGIVPVYSLGYYEDGRPFYAMRFIKGESLKDAIEQFHKRGGFLRDGGEMELRGLLARLIDVCNAVAYAHSRGVLHRDLKPGNIMLGKYGETLVVDWGLAKSVGRPDVSPSLDEPTLHPASDSNSAPTQMGIVVGTPQFMSPEQAAGRLELLGPATDVYGLGATLYCILTGISPFTADDIQQVLDHVIQGRFPPPRAIVQGIPASLEAICLRAMSRDGENRYSSAEQLARDLESWLADKPVSAYAEPLSHRAARWARQHRAWTQTTAAVLVLGLLMSTASAVLIQRARTREVRALRIAAVTDQFDHGLDRKDWTDAHLTEMNALADELESLGAAGLDEQRRRLWQTFADTVSRSLEAVTLEPGDVQRINGQLAKLSEADAKLAERLRDEFQKRLQHWQPLVDLSPPFAAVAQVFEGSGVRAEAQTLVRHAAPANQVSARLITSIPSPGNLQYESEFGPGWENETEFGLSINHLAGDVSGYDFLLRTTSPLADPSERSRPETFAANRAASESYFLEIRRNGIPLLSRPVPSQDVLPGPIRIRVTRQREKLIAQINQLQPVTMFDPFPIDPEQGKLALVWPGGVSVARLQARRQADPVRLGALAEADQLYDQKQYREALAIYQRELDRAREDAPLRQQAGYKAAACLVALNRPEDAGGLFEQVLMENGDRWPALAGCQLWLLRMKQQRTADAEVAFEHIKDKFSFEQLAALIPLEVRQQIMANYLGEFNSYVRMLRFNPERLHNIERAQAIDRYLSPDGRGESTQGPLSRAYEHLGDFEKSLRIAEEVIKHNYAWRYPGRYLRLLRLTGQAARAKREIKEHLAAAREDRSDAYRYPNLLISLAQVDAELGQWDEAEQSLDEALCVQIPAEKYNQSVAESQLSTAYLLKGFHLDREGHVAGAREIWRAGARLLPQKLAVRGDAQGAVVLAAILRSLGGELTVEQANDFAQRIMAADSDRSVAAIGSSIMSVESRHRLLSQMWATARGRKIAWGLATDSLPLADRVKLPFLLATTEYARQNAFHGDLAAEQDELLWSMAEDMFAVSIVEGSVSQSQLLKLGLAWKGTMNQFGWAGIGPTLEPSLRGRIAYVLAHRLLATGNTRQAEVLLKEAQEMNAPKSATYKLAQEDLLLLRTGQGQLFVETRLPGNIRLLVDDDVDEAAVVSIDTTARIPLPAGTYRLSIADAPGRPSPAEIKIGIGNRYRVTIE